MKGNQLMKKGPSSSLLTPMERFLSSPSKSTKIARKQFVDDSVATEAYDVPRTIGILPRGVLLDEPDGLYDGLLVDEVYVDDVAGVGKDKVAKSGSCNSSSASAAATNVVKGQWTAEEDSMLVKLVKQHGVRKWSQMAKKLAGRIGKQCRERWHNHLRPHIKKDTWSEEEERLLVEAHEKLGNRWAKIAKRIPDRSENSIKNHWNATKRRQNSKRKTNRRSSTHPSILQQYIRSHITLAEPTPTQTPALSNPVNSISSSSSTYVQEPWMPDESLDFLFMELDATNSHLDSNMDLSYPNSYHGLGCEEDRIDVGVGQDSPSFKKDMDLIEMISSFQTSSSQESTGTSTEFLNV